MKTPYGRPIVEAAQRQAPSGRERAIEDGLDDIVARVLARHLGIDRGRIRGSQHLQRDLRLRAVDLVEVTHSLARIADRDFPLHVLEGIVTVEDLTRVVRAWGRESA
jgi:hypothetical protein